MSGKELVTINPKPADKRDGDVIIHASPLPFRTLQVRHSMPYGCTLQDMVDTFCPQNDLVEAIVMVEGEIIPPGAWAQVRPFVGTHVALNIVPQGGGRKNPLSMILSIALLVVAPHISAAVLGNTLAATSVLGGLTTYGGILSGAISIVGRMVISALAPPPKPSNLGGGSNPTESPTMFIEGARNSLDPYGVVPICLGTNRLFPKQAGRPYTETKDNDQFVRQLFTYGFGKLRISDFRVGETDLAEYEEVEMVHRLNGDLHEGIGLYPNDPYQENMSILLNEVDGYTVRTTQPDSDEAQVDVTFVQGLTKFNNQGKRVAQTVQMEVQFAEHGVSPQVWSAPTGNYKAVSASAFTPDPVTPRPSSTPGVSQVGYRKDIVVIDFMSGAVQLIEGTGTANSPTSATAPKPPANNLLIATVTVKSQRTWGNPALTTTVTVTDNRQAAQVGTNYQASGDFAPSVVGTTVNIAAGGVQADPLNVTSAQVEALRKTVYMKFPTRGQYDIRIRRITPDTSDDKIFDKATLTAIRSFTYRNPVNREGLSGTAMRIKATGQLNGSLDEFNVLGSLVLPDYDAGADVWLERISSNPAALYRFVLQNYGGGGTTFANARPLGNEKIAIDDLEAWHVICDAKGYTYNRVIDYATSVDEVLRDIAAAGAASPDIQDGKRTVVVDIEQEDIAQVITPRNSYGYQGVMTYPDMPHAFRVLFRNAAKGYVMDERKVFDDGYSEYGEIPGTVAATKYETLELVSTTNADLAFKHARRHIATARLQPESHSFMLDVENLTAVRGNRIKFAHDAPIIGIGDGRIKSLIFNNDSPQLLIGFTIDDTVTIPKHGEFYVRIRCADGTTLYKEINEPPGSYSEFTFAEPFLQTVNEDDIYDPDIGDLCYFVEAGGELDLIITRIEPQDELAARVTAVAYAPARFTAESSTIPAFDSQITPPINFIRPSPPVLAADPQSDESVMLRNSDGSLTARMIVSLVNENESDELEPLVTIRESGTDVFRYANVLEANATRIALTGLEDGTNYDISIRYRRRGSVQLSLPLQINGYKFIGAGTIPPDVTGFRVQIADGTAYFAWNPSLAIDHSHHKIKFAGVFTGGSWATAQLLENNIQNPRLAVPFQPGTYFIKDVDILGNESENATAIITYSENALRNVVEVLTEDPDFPGVKDNTTVESGTLVLGDVDTDGYYYFADTVDLGEVFTAYMSAAMIANGTFVNNLFEIDDLVPEEDLFGQLGGDLVIVEDLFAVDDLFGIGEGAWAVQLEFRTTDQDPGDSPVVWTDWAEFTAGNAVFRAVQFRVLLQSFLPMVSPQITDLSVTIDMPDRIVAADDLVVPAIGLRVNFDPPFKRLKGVAIVAQDLAPGDVAEVTNKDETGFDIIFRNDVGGGVERTFDHVSSGYGRQIV